MTYYQECIEDIEQILEQTVPSSGIQGAFGRYFVEAWLDKPFYELEEPSYDESRTFIDKMDYVFSIVLAYKYGILNNYIPEYAKNLFHEIVTPKYLASFEEKIKHEDLALFKEDLKFISNYEKGHA